MSFTILYTGVSPETLPWILISSDMRSIDTGMTSSVWAVGTQNEVYFVEGRNLTRVPHKMVHVSAGEAGVWGVASNGRAFFRKGVTSWNPMGTGWVRVSGRRFRQVDSGPFGVVYAVDKTGSVRCRTKITADKLQGEYTIVTIKVKQI